MKNKGVRILVFLGIFFLASLNMSSQNIEYSYNYSQNEYDDDSYDDDDDDNEWGIDEDGRIVYRYESSGADTFYIVDEEGNRIDGLSISFEPGTVKKQVTQNYFYGDKGKKVLDTYDYYIIDSEENASELFVFFSNNTKVEWSQMLFIDNRYMEQNYISTSHYATAEYSCANLLSQPNIERLYLLTHIHNHPGSANDGYPSGLPGYDHNQSGDIMFLELHSKKEMYKRKINGKYDIELPVFYIYKAHAGVARAPLIRYDHTSKRADFN